MKPEKQKQAVATSSGLLMTEESGRAISLLTTLDIPAKGRIAHHIRTGRISNALSLCVGAQQFLWRRIWKGATDSLLEQMYALDRLVVMLRGADEKNQLSLGGIA